MGIRSFFRRAWRRADETDISPDQSWRAGDLAECIADGRWVSTLTGDPGPGPVLGEVRMVERIAYWSEPYLLFQRWPRQGFGAAHFRKIVPHADSAVPADAAFLPSLERHRATEPAR